MRITRTPRDLQLIHISESSKMFISNVYNAIQYGEDVQIECFAYCSSHCRRGEKYVQPANLRVDHLDLTQLIFSYGLPYTSLSQFRAPLCSYGADSFYVWNQELGIKTTLNKIHHIVKSHTFKEGLNERNFLRTDPEAKSSFLDPSIVWPLIRATLIYPDKCTVDYRNSRRYYIYEKLFQQVVGHGLSGCLPICKVIVDSKYNIVTAYPVRHFTVI